MNKISKAIIIAAGMGKRLNPLTNDIPKCLLRIGDKTIMERQLQTLKLCGITDAAIVRGYQGNKINFPGIKYYENANYQNNNILNSLFCAESAMNGSFIAAYSDILYDKSVVERLLENKNDIAVVVDIDWQEYYQDRTEHPLEEAEKVMIQGGQVLKIGKHLTVQDSQGEFIGLVKFSEQGAAIFKK